MESPIHIIILAAGEGSRMNSDLPKVMHKVAGKEMLRWVVDLSTKITNRLTNITIVTSPKLKEFITKNNYDGFNQINFVTQQVPRGTGDALKHALKDNPNIRDGTTLILYGDCPLLRLHTIENLIKSVKDSDDKLHMASVLAMKVNDPKQYGRMIINELGALEKIVEYKDLQPHEANLRICNSGVYAIKTDALHNCLKYLDNNNNTGEYYLTDFIEIINNNGGRCYTTITDEQETHGVNSLQELAFCENLIQQQLRISLMSKGVKMLQPESVYLSHDTIIGRGSVIYPHVFIDCGVEIGKNCMIKPFSTINESKIKDNVTIGPCAHIRPNCIIDDNVKVGNFVEVKKSIVGHNSKLSHLSYVGDATVGSNVNIGAGVITCNYDGYNKHPTTIKDGAFVGSNSTLIAPVTIGKNSVIGAGSNIDQYVEDDDLAIARAKQVNLTKKAIKYHQKRSKK